MSDPFVEDGLDDADDISTAFIDDVYRARCVDLGIASSPDAAKRFAWLVRRKISGSCVDLAQNGIGPESAAIIARWLANDDLFTTLNLARNAIGNRGVQALAQMLRCNPHLTALDLRSNDLGAQGIADLADALLSNTSVAVLDLSSDLGFHKNTLGERGAQRLAAALGAPGSRLSDLRLGNVGTSGLVCLAQCGLARSSPTLQALDLRLNHIGDDAIGAILGPIAQRAVLVQVNLARNQLSDAATPALMALLASPALKHLDLSYNLLGRSFTIAIRDAYEAGTIPALETLALDGNQRIGTQRAHNALVDGLKLSNAISSVSLSRCTIKDTAALAVLVQTSPTLQRLSLASNAIDDDDGVALGAVLAQNVTLQYLDLNDNALGDKTGVALAGSLRTNVTLQELHLKDNSLSDVSAGVMLSAIRESGRSALGRLSIQLNRISMKIWHELDAVLRSNKTNVRQGQIAAFSEQVSSLQDRERDLRAEIAKLNDELQQRSPEAAREEVEMAASTLEGFKEGEAEETEALKEQVEAESALVREQIRDVRGEHDALQSEARKAVRAFTSASHKLDMKIGIEQRKKNSTFLALRKIQKEVRDQSDLVREQTQLHDTLLKQLKDERDASKWLKDAAEKWSGKVARLTSHITSDCAEGMRLYLETLVPSPIKTTKIKQRWQRVKDRRYQILCDFNPDVFLKWFLDPARPMPSRSATSDSAADDANAGYALHVKVATSPSMIDGNHAKLIHASHSVYSMSLHGMGQVSTILVGLHDPQLALEFRALRSDVAHVVIRAAGHVKMEEFRAMVAERIGVDETDISALYHTTLSETKSRAPDCRLYRHRSLAPNPAVTEVTIDSEGLSSSDDDCAQKRAEKPSEARSSKRRRRPRPVNFQLRSGTAEARNEGAIPVRSALKEVQEMFPEPLDSADERDPGSDCDSIDSEVAEKKISTPPHHASLRPLQRSRSLSNATNSNSTTIDNPAASPTRRKSDPAPSHTRRVRQCTELMPWSYQHDEHRKRTLSVTSEMAPPETDLRVQLASNESALGPMHPAVSTTLGFIGHYYTSRGMYSEAEAAYSRALHIREKALGRRHPHVATTLHDMALLYAAQPDRLHQAEPLLQRAVTIREKALGPNNPIVADSLIALGRLYQRLGQRETAEPLFIRALTIRERIYGKRHSSVQETLNDLGRIFMTKSRIVRTNTNTIIRKATTFLDAAATLYKLDPNFDNDNNHHDAEPSLPVFKPLTTRPDAVLPQRRLQILDIGGAERPSAAAIAYGNRRFLSYRH